MKYFKRVIASMLTVILLVNLFPGAMAKDEDSVLQSISLKSGVLSSTTVEPGSTRDITLKVPYAYSDSTKFDLKNDLVYAVDLTAYKSVVITPEKDEITITEEAAKSYVKLTVTFNLYSEADNAERSETVYNIRVVREAQIVSDFSGVINQKLEKGTTVDLSTAIKNKYIQNEGKTLSSIKIIGSNSDVGTLSFPEDSTFSSVIPLSSFADLKFEATDCGVVSYDIAAYDDDTGTNQVGTAVLTIMVYDKPIIESKITDTVYTGSTKTFTAKDFTSHCELYNDALVEIDIKLAQTTAGTWYLNGKPVPVDTNTQISASSISGLTFKATTSGEANFTWNAKNASGYAIKEGAGTLTVGTASLTLSSYTSSTMIEKGATHTALASNFSFTPSSAIMTYLKIVTIPAAADGTICLTTALPKNDTLGYPAIAANATLKAGAIIPYSYIKNLKLVTKSTSTNTSASFTWSATASNSLADATWADAASYTVRFKTTGTISYSTQMNVPVTLDASDFSTQYRNATGYTLSYVTFTLPVATSGKLFSSYSFSTKTGTSVTASTKYYAGANPNLSNITFVPATDYSGTVSIKYSAYKSDGTYVSGILEITVSKMAGGTVSYTIDKNDWVRFDAAAFLKSFKDSTGEELSYVKFSLPSTSRGKLYYDYKSSSNYSSTVSSTTKYNVYSSAYLSYVTYVAAKDYLGTVSINYTAYNKDGDSYSGKLIIFIVDSAAGIVSYTSKVNSPVLLSGDDFADEFISVTGSVMSYVQISMPDKNSGVLYYDYSTDTKTGGKVSASTKYYNGASPDISNITFVPATDYTGKMEVKYTVYTSAGKAYIGKLKIAVGETGGGAVSFSTDLNTPLKFNTSSFSSQFFSYTGGNTLSYLIFNLPSSTYGKLYYNYTSSTSTGTIVDGSTKYYISSSPYLSYVSFVPKSGYTGSFTITYTGYTANGTSFPGKIQISVGGSDGTIYYETAPNDAVNFSLDDFNNACETELGETLHYVKFGSVPSSVYGTLYYGFSSSSNVSSSTKYYYSSSPYISQIAFLPKSDYSGAISIAYTGYSTKGDSFDGVVIIKVATGDGGTVSYETDNETPVMLNSTDFNAVFLKETGSSLYYVKFKLPSAACGQLYYDYNSSSSNNSKVSTSTNYYRSVSPLLSDVTFVPNESFSGIVTIFYTAYSTSSVAYTGELDITVTDGDVYPFSDVEANYSWASEAILYLSDNNVVLGSGDRLFRPGVNMSRGDFMLMVYRAFDLSAPISGNFSDVPSGSYYYNAIAVAKALGITQGSGGKFNPDTSISRQDAMVIIMRTLEIDGNPLAEGSASDLSGYSDQNNISSYAVNSVAALVNAGIVRGSGGALNPKSMISRAEMAVLLYNVLTM